MSLGILISGRGSNMVALLAQAALLPPISLILSDQPEAPGLTAARAQGYEVAVCPREKGQSKAAHEAAMAATLAGCEYLALAGFMRILSAEFIARFSHVFNIHPSLLPAFPGLDTHARAIAAGAQTHGCSVHLVDAGMDTGPRIAQAGLPVRKGEDAAGLAARVLRLEHALYAPAIANFLVGKARNKVLAERGASQ